MCVCVGERHWWNIPVRRNWRFALHLVVISQGQEHRVEDLKPVANVDNSDGTKATSCFRRTINVFPTEYTSQGSECKKICQYTTFLSYCRACSCRLKYIICSSYFCGWIACSKTIEMLILNLENMSFPQSVYWQAFPPLESVFGPLVFNTLTQHLGILYPWIRSFLLTQRSLFLFFT